MSSDTPDRDAQSFTNGSTLAHSTTMPQASVDTDGRLAGKLPRPVRRAYRVGVRAASAAEEEVEEWVQRILNEGEKLETRSRELLHRFTPGYVSERQASQVAVEAVQTTEGIEQMIERVLTRLNVPTKADIDRLSRRITELSQKVDELKAATVSKT